MKALHFLEHGGIENLKFGEVDDPKQAPGQALVRVKACALNHLDLWVLKGLKGLELEMPHIGGSDISGVIEESTEKFKAGTRVVINPGVLSENDSFRKENLDSLSPNYKIIGEHLKGGFSELISVPEENLYVIPDEINFESASAPLLVGLTAYRMLVRVANIKKDDKVVVVGAGGGLNSFAIQLASHLGATVIAITSTEAKEEKALKLGAKMALNYKRKKEWGKEVLRVTEGLGAEIIVDNVGAASMPQSLIAAKPGGAIVTVGNTSGPKLTIDNRYIFSKQIKILGSTMGSKQDFEELLPLLWSGKLKPVIDSVIPLSEGKAAYERLASGEQFGKIILKI